MKTNLRKGIYALKEMYRMWKKAWGVDIKEVWLNKDERMVSEY